MTGKERIKRILNHERADRIGFHETFWWETVKKYRDEGHLKADERHEDHFNYDLDECWTFNMTADLDFKPKILREDKDTKTELSGNGAVLRWKKHESSTPEHIDFTVKEQKDWLPYREHLTAKKDFDRRINFEAYRSMKKDADSKGRFFNWSGVNVFECMHPVCGHENMLVGMVLEPEWILDMGEVYSDLTVELMKILFEREGKPDGLFFYEDMGFKERPFMSPDMYRELIMPSHIKTIEFAHSLGLPVFMHSCGFIEPLLPHMVEAGIDCLQAMEVKAGMDLLRIHRNFGKKIALFGGIDVRVLYSNDKKKIDAELESKIPIVKKSNGFILHSDHSIPPQVEYETIKYFFKKGLELGIYN